MRREFAAAIDSKPHRSADRLRDEPGTKETILRSVPEILQEAPRQPRVDSRDGDGLEAADGEGRRRRLGGLPHRRGPAADKTIFSDNDKNHFQAAGVGDCRQHRACAQRPRDTIEHHAHGEPVVERVQQSRRLFLAARRVDLQQRGASASAGVHREPERLDAIAFTARALARLHHRGNHPAVRDQQRL